MEPISTTVKIGTIVGYLAQKLKDNKSIQAFFDDFTEATVNWIRPVFLEKDNQPKEVLIDLTEDADDKLNQDAAVNALAKMLKKNPDAEKIIQEMFEVIEKKDPIITKNNIATITGDSNKTYQDINGSTITDSSTSQTHSGSGDNIGRDKITN